MTKLARFDRLQLRPIHVGVLLWAWTMAQPLLGAVPGHWRTPVSVYPPAALAKRITGKGTVRVTTDENGWVTEASMVNSTGSSLLDAATVRAARAGWQGPQNTTANLPVEYRLPPVGSEAPKKSNHPGWTILKHEYPTDPADVYEQGLGIVRATTGPDGRVATATMVRSTGHARLDEDALAYARNNWRGPVSASIEVPVVYRLDTAVPVLAPPGPGKRWVTPRPYYPFGVKMQHGTGSGVIKVSTDERGRVIRATMIQSTGQADLDENTVNYALARWSGPPESECRVPITYRLL